MTEKTLIPLDGSPFAEAALHYIEELVARLEPRETTEITLLMVVSPHYEHINVEGGVVDIPEDSPEIQKTIADGQEYLEKAAAVLRKHGVTVNCNVKYKPSPADAIIEAENECGADLVAMSTHGRRGITRWAFGSVTDKVLRAGSAPVLMVRARQVT